MIPKPESKRGHHQRKKKRVSRKTWIPIAERIAAAHGITVNEMLWHGQARTYFMPRAIFWRHLRGLGRFSYPAIAAITGHDHTTVIDACKSPAVLEYIKTHRPKETGPELIGRRFGNLTVIEAAPRWACSDNPRWKCRCDCGRLHTLSQPQLLDTSARSKVFCFSPRTIRREQPDAAPESLLFRGNLAAAQILRRAQSGQAG